MSSNKIKLNIRSIDFDVTFDYQPEEKEVRYYSDGSGYPGCPASITYIHIEFQGVDFDEFFENEIGKVEELIWQSFEDESNI